MGSSCVTRYCQRILQCSSLPYSDGPGSFITILHQNFASCYSPGTQVIQYVSPPTGGRHHLSLFKKGWIKVSLAIFLTVMNTVRHPQNQRRPYSQTPSEPEKTLVSLCQTHPASLINSSVLMTHVLWVTLQQHANTSSISFNDGSNGRSFKPRFTSVVS